MKRLSDEISDRIYVIMRVYFEKPRSVLGWKGLINDPYMNDTFQIEDGIRMARRFLVRVAEIGLPAATEVLDTLMPQYIGDLISWSVIGARTAEAQTHRECHCISTRWLQKRHRRLVSTRPSTAWCRDGTTPLSR